MNNEIEHIITKPMTLRKFYNFICRAFAEKGMECDIDWLDFKRWNGQICDCFTDRDAGCTYKLIAEYGEDSCYFYYRNA